MINGINPLDSLFSNSSSSSALDPLGSSLNFGTTFDQAMVQAKTPGDKAKVLFAQAKFNEQLALADMFSGSPLSLGSGLSDLFSTGGSLGLPSWAYDAQRVLGNNSDAAKMVGLSQQAALLAQSTFSDPLSSLGTSGSGFDSLF